MPDGPPVVEEICEELPPLASGTCEVTPGNGKKLLKGVVLTPGKVFRGGQVLVDETGQITCTGCDCAAGGETVISCPDGAISPGLINTHDHITFTQNAPYNETSERYEHRHQWRKGQDMHTKIPSSGGASADQVSWGELRFLFGGATSIVGSGSAKGLLRNLDRADQEGLNQTPVNFDTFPLDDSGGSRKNGDCNYGGTPTTAASIDNVDAYEPHTAEGIDATARNEFLCESSDTFDTATPGVSNNLLLPKTAMIHGIGLQPADYAAMAQAGTGLIWSPRSNITLYGDTARVTTAHRLGVEIALGTDWMPTGSMNLLRELKCADELNQNYYHYFSDLQLWQMVTSNAAAVTATDDVIGVLAPGKVADISIFAAHGKTYRAVIDAEPADVVLVLRGGKPLYGDAAILTATAEGCDALDVCGTPKQVCLQSEVGKNLAALTQSVGNIYEIFSCDLPPDEPTCTPSRTVAVSGSTVYDGVPTAGDADGDGIPDASDKCPSVFDPIRPMDNGEQGDADGDGEGDACDVCPLDAGTTTCSSVNPDDRDHDGVANNVDNCPDDANPDQADPDMDGKGSVCDACPMDSNPGNTGCPATIYTIKMGATAVGTVVRVSNVLVTGKGSNGFFVQVKSGDAGFLGADFSGLFVFTGTNAPTLANATVGARVTIDGRVANFSGQLEIENPTSVTVVSAGPEAAPDPVLVTYAQAKTGGARAAALESVLVTLNEVATATANNPQFGEYTLTPNVAGDAIIADDFLFVPNPLPLNQVFNKVTGILAMRQSASKIEPRGAADLTSGPPKIASFGPSPTFARSTATINEPTFPDPLTITLTGPAQGDTLVTLTSSSNTLTVQNLTIPSGASSIVVPVTAGNPGLDVTVTASIAGDTPKNATVTVLGSSQPATTVTLSPAAVTVAPNGSVELTVTAFPPPAADTTINLSFAAGTGTIPATVTVLADHSTATFTYVNTGANATVRATLGGSTSDAVITVSTGANHLVINEVDYDQDGTDAAEFVEIFNPTGSPISLSGVRLVLINGSDNTAYADIDLTNAVPGGSLAAGAYLVIAGANVSAALKFDPGFITNAIQNGAPDGLALIDMNAGTIIDKFSYEGSVLMAELPGFATPQSLVEGTALATNVADTNDATPNSLCRRPDGTDTNNAATDWKLCTSSPGMPNP